MKRIATLTLALSAFAAVQAQSVVSLVQAPTQHFTPLSQLQPDDYMANTMIIKVLPEHRGFCSNEMINISAVHEYFQMIGVDHIERTFPLHKAPEKKYNAQGMPMIDLSLIYTVHYSSSMPLERAIGKLYNFGFFEFVEPYFIPKTDLTPNDPQATQASSYHIYKIAAASTSGLSGWDISTGSASVVIGITDTGTELTHSDLTNQIAYNTADPIDGNDNDGDGFIDNYRGWDVAMNDNDPTWQGNAHGVHVSGCAAAQVNNNTGVAGSGYNCKFLPVKIADAAGTLTASYQGITYAADHGCKVINCSWGGTGGGSFGQAVIDYATNNMDALVVCAAGNNSADQAFFPAAYDKVLSVGSTASNDVKSSFSNWNYTVDICSPGSNINATWIGNSYTTQSGTSMASPVCAGAAAIVRAFYPSFNAMQTGERLRMTADNIYAISANQTYQDKIGTGRVNLYRALTDPASTSLIYENRVSTDNNDNVYVAGDTLRFTGNFHNYLSATTNLVATLSVVTPGGYVTIVDGTTNPGAIASLASVGHNPDPFQVKINASAPQNAAITFKLTLTDGSWTLNQYFTETVNVDYINVTVNDVWTTITSKGLIGYNADQQQQGLGFNYQQGGTLLYEAGLMIGNSSALVNDVVRGTNATPDAEFTNVQTVRQVVPLVVSDFDAWGRFSDAAAASQLPVRVTHTAYAWIAPPHSKYVIVQYVIKNNGASTLNSLYAGIFADWDIDAATYGSNKADFDAANKMGYVYYTGSNGKYCGIKLLTSTAPVVHYAIDNITGGGGGIDASNGYDTNEKYTTLSTNRQQAGGTGSGNDVCDVVSSGPFTIASGDSVVVAFALIAGDNLGDLQNSATDAQIQYDNQVPLGISLTQSPVEPTLSEAFPNPTNGNTAIAFNLPTSGDVNMNLFDASGRQVANLASGSMNSGVHTVQFDASQLAEGMYICRLEANGMIITRKVLVTH